jgi:cytochrome c-type biogenesis protein
MRFEAKTEGGSAFGAYLLGLAFAFGWTPCLGPILGSILTVAASEASASRGTALLLAYSLGLGLPFIAVAAFFPRLTGLMGFLRHHMQRIERIMGLLLWTIGLMLVTGQFSDLSRWILETFPWAQSLG